MYSKTPHSALSPRGNVLEIAILQTRFCDIHRTAGKSLSQEKETQNMDGNVIGNRRHNHLGITYLYLGSPEILCLQLTACIPLQVWHKAKHWLCYLLLHDFMAQLSHDFYLQLCLGVHAYHPHVTIGTSRNCHGLDVELAGEVVHRSGVNISGNILTCKKHLAGQYFQKQRCKWQ